LEIEEGENFDLT
jgi:hypothetical protein